MIYSFSPFGYEGSLVSVEADLRRGIPSVDIVGLADGSIKESRERMRSAIENSGFEFPPERILISLSPADLKKEGAGFDLAMALAVLSAKDDFPRACDSKVLAIGTLELNGSVTYTRGIYNSLQCAKSSGIKYAIAPDLFKDDLPVPDGIHVEYVHSLKDAYDALVRIYEAEVYGDSLEEYARKDDCIHEDFPGFDSVDEFYNLDSVQGMDGLKYAMAIAVAGKHHMLVTGAPGCGKSSVLNHIRDIVPRLTAGELV